MHGCARKNERVFVSDSDYETTEYDDVERAAMMSLPKICGDVCEELLVTPRLDVDEDEDEVTVAAAVPISRVVGEKEFMKDKFDEDIFGDVLADAIVDVETPLQKNAQFNTLGCGRSFSDLPIPVHKNRNKSPHPTVQVSVKEKGIQKDVKRLRQCANKKCGHYCGSRAKVCKMCSTPLPLTTSKATQYVRRFRERRKVGRSFAKKILNLQSTKSVKRLRVCSVCSAYIGPRTKNCKRCGTPAPKRTKLSEARAAFRRKKSITILL